jgi:hypothetical protein
MTTWRSLAATVVSEVTWSKRLFARVAVANVKLKSVKISGGRDWRQRGTKAISMSLFLGRFFKKRILAQKPAASIRLVFLAA